MPASLLRIVQERTASPEEWETACRQCEWATFFHTPAWARVWEAASGGSIRPRPISVGFSDGVTAVIPLSEKRRVGPFFRTRLSSPASTYGGWISQSALSVDHARILASWMVGQSDIVWRENPYDPHLCSLQVEDATEDFAQVIDLRREMSVIEKEAGRAHHKAIRKARDSAVTVRRAGEPGEWDSYLAMYGETMKRWESGSEGVGPITYKGQFFRVLRDCAPPASLRLWLAERASRPIAGVVAFYHNHHCVLWHGAALSDELQYRPNNLLYWEVLKDAHSRGYWWFDCNPAGGHEGVEKFKEYLGCRKVRSRVIVRQSPLLKVLRRLRSGRQTA